MIVRQSVANATRCTVVDSVVLAVIVRNDVGNYSSHIPTPICCEYLHFASRVSTCREFRWAFFSHVACAHRCFVAYVPVQSRVSAGKHLSHILLTHSRGAQCMLFMHYHLHPNWIRYRVHLLLYHTRQRAGVVKWYNDACTQVGDIMVSLHNQSAHAHPFVLGTDGFIIDFLRSDPVRHDAHNGTGGGRWKISVTIASASSGILTT